MLPLTTKSLFQDRTVEGVTMGSLLSKNNEWEQRGFRTHMIAGDINR
jgi:hypothetical protein